MPAYHQIETYIQLKSLNDLPLQLERFSNLLQCIGVLNQKIQNWFGTISWEESEDGFVYAVDPGNAQLKSTQSALTLTVRPSFLGLTPRIVPQIRNNWVSFSLLFLSYEVDDVTYRPTIRYKNEASEILLNIMRIFANIFTEEHIFFTDEAQDGEPWHGRIENDQKKMWYFEIGTVPTSFRSMTNKPNEKFYVWEENERTWFLRKEAFSASLISE